MPTVKEAFTYRFSFGKDIDVPAGARVTRNRFATDEYWVDPSVFPNSLDQFDAEHYGVRVPASNVKDLE